MCQLITLVLGKLPSYQEKYLIKKKIITRGTFRTQSIIYDGTFAKTVNGWKSLTIFAKSFILDI